MTVGMEAIEATLSQVCVGLVVVSVAVIILYLIMRRSLKA